MTTIPPLEYTLARMADIKPRYDELGHRDKLEGDERDEYNRLTAEWDELDVRRIDLEDRNRRAQAAGNVNFNVNRNPDPFQVDLRHMDSLEACATGRAAIAEMAPRCVSPEQAEDLTRLVARGGSVGETAARLAITTGSAEYRREWLNYMTGKDADRRLLERANDEYRAMTAGTGNTGGYMVPLYMDPSFSVTGTGSYNPIRDVANVKQITTLTYNGSNAAQVTAAILGENAAYSDNAPVVAQIQLPTYKYGAYIPASFEAFEDIDTLATDVGELFSDAKANLEATQFATGTGSAPHGVVTDVTAVSGSRVAPATGGTFVLGDLYKVHAALPPRYRQSSRPSRGWMASVQVIDLIRQFATANNYNAFLTDLRGGNPPQMLGDPLMEASTMATAVTTGNNILLYGDFHQFLIIDRVGISTEFIPNVFDQASGRPSGTRAWLMHWRFGSGAADANAFRILLL